MIEDPPINDDVYLIEDINPRWNKWFSAQSDDAKTSILAFWKATDTNPDISASHLRAEHARATFLLRWCADNYGYEL